MDGLLVVTIVWVVGTLVGYLYGAYAITAVKADLAAAEAKLAQAAQSVAAKV